MLNNTKVDINPIKNQQNSIWNFLKNFDIFGITFNFRINSEEKFQSSTGGLWLIVFILLSIFLMINTIINFFRNPVYNSYYSEEPLNFTDPHYHIKFYEEKFDYGFYLNINPLIFPNDTFMMKGFYLESNKNSNYTNNIT